MGLAAAGRRTSGAAGVDGLLPFLESKAMLLDGPTAAYEGTDF